MHVPVTCGDMEIHNLIKYYICPNLSSNRATLNLIRKTGMLRLPCASNLNSRYISLPGGNKEDSKSTYSSVLQQGTLNAQSSMQPALGHAIDNKLCILHRV
jgi:hypothetical protein